MSELLDCDVDYFLGKQGEHYRKEIKEIQTYTGLSKESSEIIFNLSDTEKEALDIMLSTSSLVNIIKSLIKVASFINHNGEISIVLENNMWNRHMINESVPDDLEKLEEKLNSHDTRKMFEFQMQQEISDMVKIILNNESWCIEARKVFFKACTRGIKLQKRYRKSAKN